MRRMAPDLRISGVHRWAVLVWARVFISGSPGWRVRFRVLPARFRLLVLPICTSCAKRAERVFFFVHGGNSALENRRTAVRDAAGGGWAWGSRYLTRGTWIPQWNSNRSPVLRTSRHGSWGDAGRGESRADEERTRPQSSGSRQPCCVRFAAGNGAGMGNEEGSPGLYGCRGRGCPTSFPTRRRKEACRASLQAGASGDSIDGYSKHRTGGERQVKDRMNPGGINGKDT